MRGALFDGIDGVEGTVPFGAIVSVGQKGPKGNPTNTDRFFIVSTAFEEVSGAKGQGFSKLRHPLDSRYEPFNGIKKGDKRATVLRGNLLFPDRSDCMNHHLAAQQLGNGRGQAPPGGGVWETPPRAMPACTGDGKTAQRYNGMVDGEPSFVSISCPNRLCPFRMGQKKICGAFGRLYFRLRWAEGTQEALLQRNGEPLPSILVRYQTHAWNSVENMVGMFDAVEGTAKGLGIPPDSWSYAGLPFEMTVGLKKIPDKGRSFPVVSFAIGDLFEFFRWQVEQRQYLLAAPRSVTLIGDGMEHDESSPEAIGEALDILTPGDGIPAVVEPVEPGPPQVEAEVLEPEPAVDPEPAEAAKDEPPVTVYRVDPRDPRPAVDRLHDYAIDALQLTTVELLHAARKVAGCDPVDVQPMFEGAVAEELTTIARSRSS